MPKPLKLLFVNSGKSDFLADSFIIGLKRLPNIHVCETPGNNFVYQDIVNSDIHGKGFTLYGMLNPEKRNVVYNPSFSDFDVVIFGNIHINQYDVYSSFLKSKSDVKAIFLDGADDGYIFPYRGPWLRRISTWLMPKPHRHFPYFKREWVEHEMQYSLNLPWSKLGIQIKKQTSNIFPISFSIPEEKIITQIPNKTQLFASHIVDEEVAKACNAKTTYIFDNEQDYYADLAKSKFGITTKRAGWDCLRHYEIASQGAVICFKDFEKKPKHCAPHGLKPGINCISYSNHTDLMEKLGRIDAHEYSALQRESLKWIKSMTTRQVVSRTLRASGLIID
jgi:hypothetical protein